jgi:hypothetical protein
MEDEPKITKLDAAFMDRLNAGFVSSFTAACEVKLQAIPCDHERSKKEAALQARKAAIIKDFMEWSKNWLGRAKEEPSAATAPACPQDADEPAQQPEPPQKKPRLEGAACPQDAEQHPEPQEPPQKKLKAEPSE